MTSTTPISGPLVVFEEHALLLIGDGVTAGLAKQERLPVVWLFGIGGPIGRISCRAGVRLVVSCASDVEVFDFGSRDACTGKDDTVLLVLGANAASMLPMKRSDLFLI